MHCIGFLISSSQLLSHGNVNSSDAIRYPLLTHLPTVVPYTNSFTLCGNQCQTFGSIHHPPPSFSLADFSFPAHWYRSTVIALMTRLSCALYPQCVVDVIFPGSWNRIEDRNTIWWWRNYNAIWYITALSGQRVIGGWFCLARAHHLCRRRYASERDGSWLRWDKITTPPHTG